MKKQIKILTGISVLFLICFNLFGQASYKIDYYGVVSTDIDANMYKMTSDLYYTQLCEINLFTVQDKRTDEPLSKTPDVSSLSEDALSFFAVISKDENSSKWYTSLNLVNKKITHSETKEYDSYYKILMEPKDVLQNTIKSLIKGDFDLPKTNESFSKTVTSTEFLSGTWNGENGINKIVIMRGGRGFVIFDNGASMNIVIQLEKDGTVIKISQTGKSNASFYPDIPRETALNLAVDAKPIIWELKVADNNTLSGVKTTLVKDGFSAKEGTVNVTWKRRD